MIKAGALGPNGLSLVPNDLDQASQSEKAHSAPPVHSSGDGGLDGSLKNPHEGQTKRFQRVVDLLKEAERRRGSSPGRPVPAGVRWRKHVVATYQRVRDFARDTEEEIERLRREA